jgi:hypothetical protein
MSDSDPPVSVEQDRVVMVALGDGQDDVDPEPLCCLGQAVGEHLVGQRVGPQQELALGTATREEVEATWQHLTRTRHGYGVSNAYAGRVRMELRENTMAVAACVRSWDNRRLQFNPGRVHPRCMIEVKVRVSSGIMTRRRHFPWLALMPLGVVVSCGTSSHVYAIKMITPTGQNQGEYYLPTLLTEGASFLVILDTGSSDTALAGAGCATCTGTSPLYSPGSGAKNTDQQDEIVYGDGASWAGEVYTDTVGLGNDTPNVKLNLVDVTTQKYFFQGNDNEYQGILGMGRDALLGWGTTSFMDAITDAGVARKIGVEMCPTDGMLWLGGVDTSHSASALEYTPLVQSRRNSNFYSIGMTGMALDSVDLGSASDFQDPIVDTGTTLFYVPDTVETGLISAINSNSAFQALFPDQTLVAPTEPTDSTAGGVCVGAASMVTDQMIDEMLPPLKMTFDAMGDGGSITITAPALESYFVDAGAGQYCLAIVGGANYGNVIMGDTFLRGFVTEIDLVDNRVGFAPTGCPTALDSGAVQHRMVERGRGPRKLADERDRAEANRSHASVP